MPISTWMGEAFGASGTALRERIGTLAQVVRIDSFVEAEGPARGTRRLRMVNGGGLEVEVHPDRALDLGQMTVDGMPTSWISPTEIASPHDYEPHGTGWLRTFGGGLLATCGLDTFGPPGEDAGTVLGMHGRIGTRPARILRAEATANGVVVQGVVRQASVFGENLVLHRTISSLAGSSELRVDDVVTNEGFSDCPHMILYHCNLGWPLLGDSTTVNIPSKEVIGRDAAAVPGLDARSEVGPPIAGWDEQVFVHSLDRQSPSTVRIVNPDNGLELGLTIDGASLPFVYQWKMTGQGHYVVGVEPSNCGTVLGRAAARDAGDLPVLGAGESVAYGLAFDVRRTRRTSRDD